MNILSNLKKDQMKLSWTFGHTIHNMLINFFYNSLKGISVDFT